MIYFLLLCMLFMHIVDDYYLQGILAKMKQQKWWQENAPSKKYKNDYIVALYMHAFSWAFMIMLPLAIFCKFNLGWFYLAYPINTIIHALVDDLKANRNKLNLFKDQLIHYVQIFITYCLFVILL